MAGVLKIDIFQVDDNGEKVIDGLNKVYNIEDLDYTVKLLNNENLIPTLIIERLITVNKTTPEHTQVPLEIYKFFNINNSNLPYTHEDFIKFSVEIHLDELLIYSIPYIKTISYALTQPRVHEVDNTYLKTEMVSMTF